MRARVDVHESHFFLDKHVSHVCWVTLEAPSSKNNSSSSNNNNTVDVRYNFFTINEIN